MKTLKSFFTICFVFLTSFVFMTSSSLAIGGTGGLDGAFEGWFTNVLTWIIGLAGLVAAAVLILNAFMFITASGDEAKVKKATSGITYAIIGLVIAAIAFLIVNYVIKKI